MVRSIVRTLLVSGVATSWVIGATGCSFSFTSSHEVSKSDIEKKISDMMAERGNRPQSVSCPHGLEAHVGATLNCEMKFQDQPYPVSVTTTAVDGSDVKFDVLEVVGKDQVASRLSDQLTQRVGRKPDAVTCPEDLKGIVGTKLQCRLTDGTENYDVAVTVTSIEIPQIYFDYKVGGQAG